VWNHGNPEPGSLLGAARHGEADAIHGNTGFIADVTTEGRVPPAHFEVPRLGKSLHSHHLTNAIHVAAHQMAAKTIGETQGWLKIHRCTPQGFGTQDRSLQGLFTDIRQKAITDQLCHGQADTIHGHAVTQHQGGEGCTAFHQQRTTTPLDVTHRLNQTREHRPSRGPVICS